MDPNMMRKGRPPFPNGMRGMPYDPTMMMAGPNMMPRGDEMYMMNGGRKNMGKDFNRDGSSRGNRNDGYKNSFTPPSADNPMQDPLVDDFRSTYGKTKQWNLIDLQGHVVAFCQDQHGSRFIQQRLEVCSDVDKQLIFDEILPTAQSLMTDVFGNYVLQKLFEFGTPDQCESLARLLTNQCVQLSMQMYGCRVVQKALEYVGTDRLIAIVGEFENPPVLLRCVHDSNGNHVIQKCIEITSKAAQDLIDTQPEVAEYLNSRIEIIIEAFKGRVKELSSHPYGCRVIQRILEHGSNDQKTIILEELRQYYPELIQDMYGNYVIQFVMQHGWESDRQILIKEVQSKLLDFSQHKFASNVVERCLQFANKKDKDEMIWAIINATFDLNNPVDAKTGHCVLESMVRDPYGNYVVQKVIDVSDERQRGAIMRYIKENIVQLRRYTYGKHIIVRLEKITGEKF
jgi:pumilio RNA-binding family